MSLWSLEKLNASLPNKMINSLNNF